jgi:hypothetical protein
MFSYFLFLPILHTVGQGRYELNILVVHLVPILTATSRALPCYRYRNH